MSADSPALKTRNGRVVSPHTILVADDHQLVLKGLVRVIDDEETFLVTGTATDGQAVLRLLGQSTFDLVLLDFHLPLLGGIELIRQIRRYWPTQKILVLTFDGSAGLARATIGAGADGFITKTSDSEELLRALRKVTAGEHYMEPSLMEAVVFLPHQERGCAVALTPREQQVLRMLAAGMSNRSIAAQLQLSEKTVSTHRVRLSKKLNASSLSDLMQRANQIGSCAMAA